MPNIVPEHDSSITAELERLVALDKARARQIISDIPAFVQQITAATIDPAVDQGLQQYTVSALMMKLD